MNGGSNDQVAVKIARVGSKNEQLWGGCDKVSVEGRGSQVDETDGKATKGRNIRTGARSPRGRGNTKGETHKEKGLLLLVCWSVAV